ncbi:hypothetical protein M8A51_17310 [Schlegelella sp. S2-27]|uniref:Uncharacterized protein n=1 Tax=Caldimonas mangrovi TaxID=2944811 RepID=A0ABT0YSL9_9BURK|nr:hypothetical protein [Caldimonas mangrovi]MCM5681287.1 hypothetical protein [Caldimonas mangrovi]
MASRTTPSARARGQSTSRPQAVMEYAALAAAAASAGKSAADVLSLVAPLLKGKVVLPAQVLRSGRVGAQHRVLVRLTNVTSHGVYVLGLRLERPKDVPLACWDAGGKPIGFDEQAERKTIGLPLWLGPTDAREMVLSFDADATAQTLHHWLWGTLLINYQALGARDPAQTEVDFSIRNEAP